jgi:Carbohydrate family 9 binding domain-like
MGDPRPPVFPALAAVLLVLGACDLAASGLAGVDASTPELGGTDAAADVTRGGGYDASDAPVPPPPVDSGLDAFVASDGAAASDAGVDGCAVEDGGTSDTVVATHAKTPLSIDGKLDDWICPNFHSLTIQNAGYTTTPGGGPVSPSAGIGVDFAVAWDPGHLYFAAIVTDPSLEGGDPEPFNNDSVELYVTNDAPLTGDYTKNDHQIDVDYQNNVGEYSQGSQVTVTGIQSAVGPSSGGYIIEASLDVTQIGVSAAAAGGSFGFDIGLNDRAGGIGQANVLDWHVAPGANCGCPNNCCCQSTPQVPFCSTFADGTLVLAP